MSGLALPDPAGRVCANSALNHRSLTPQKMHLSSACATKALKLLRNIQDNLARESFRAPVEVYLALQLVSNHARDHARAEALTRGRRDDRAARLGPAEDEPFVSR